MDEYELRDKNRSQADYDTIKAKEVEPNWKSE